MCYNKCFRALITEAMIKCVIIDLHIVQVEAECQCYGAAEGKCQCTGNIMCRAGIVPNTTVHTIQI